MREEKEKKKKEKQPGFFSPGQTRPAGCATPGFSRLFGAFKSSLKGKSFEFYVHLMYWYYFA
jgi:hypothetical protein